MSSWVPLCSAPPEQICVPSTSYASQLPIQCHFRPRHHRGGLQSRRGRALQFLRCQAAPAIHTYHNAYKLLHPSKARPAGSPLGSQQPEQRGSQQPQAPPVPPLQLPASMQQRPGDVALLPPPGQQQHQRSAAQQQQDQQQQQRQLAAPGQGPSGQLSAVILPGTLLTPAAPPDFIPSTATPPPLPPSTGATRVKAAGSSSSAAAPDAPLLDGGLEALILTAATTTNQPPYRRHAIRLHGWSPPKTSVEHQTARTHAIMSAPNYTSLHTMIMEGAQEFNTHHSCASLNRLLELHARGLSPRESRMFTEGCLALLAILKRQLPELRPRSLVVVAHSLARLELPDRELLAGLVTATEPQLHGLQAQGLSCLLWSFARLGFQPPARWMDGWLAACGSKLGSFHHRELATSVWALAKLRYKVAPPVQQLIMTRVRSQLPVFQARGLSNLAYALALIQQHPGPELLSAMQARAAALGQSAFTPQGLTQLCWGLAKLGAIPTRELLRLIYGHVLPRLPHRSTKRQMQQQRRILVRSLAAPGAEPAAGAAGTGRPPSRRGVEADGSGGDAAGSTSGSESTSRRGGSTTATAAGTYNGVDMATLMYVLGLWGARPSPGLGKQLLTALQAVLPSLEPNQLCNVAWACARLNMFPSRTFVKRFINESYRKLPVFGPGDLSQALWALARLQAYPPDAWMSLALHRLTATAYMFGPVEVANTLWSLASLGVRRERMPAEVFGLLFIATDRRLSSFKTKELCSMIWALAVMRQRPDKEWAAEFIKVSYHRLAAMSGRALATLIWSLAQLTVLPPPAWLYSFVNAARARLQATLSAAAAMADEPAAGTVIAEGQLQQQQPKQPGVMVGGQEMGVAASQAVRGAASSDGGDNESGLSALDLGQIIKSLRRMNGGNGSSNTSSSTTASNVTNNSNNGVGNGSSADNSSNSSSSSGRSGGLGLAKVDDFLGEAEAGLAAMEAADGAYSRVQLGYFLQLAPGAPPPPQQPLAGRAGTVQAQPSRPATRQSARAGEDWRVGRGAEGSHHIGRGGPRVPAVSALDSSGLSGQAWVDMGLGDDEDMVSSRNDSSNGSNSSSSDSGDGDEARRVTLQHEYLEIKRRLAAGAGAGAGIKSEDNGRRQRRRSDIGTDVSSPDDVAATAVLTVGIPRLGAPAAVAGGGEKAWR